MNEAEAKAELVAVDRGFEALYNAARAADDDCWWCCGGGDEWRAELEARRTAALNALSLAQGHRH